MTELTKVVLDESEIPQAWYNIQPDLPKAFPTGFTPRYPPTRRAPRGNPPSSRAHPRDCSAVREARRAREAGEETVILTALCGHGHFDMSAYEAFLNGTLEDFEYPSEKVAASMERIPVLA